MYPAYVVLTLVTAAATLAGAWLNFTHHRISVEASRQVGTPDSLMRPVSGVFFAATVGLLAGLVFRPLGIAAAVGLVLHFILAVLAHLRVRDFHLGAPLGALGLVTANLALTVAA